VGKRSGKIQSSGTNREALRNAFADLALFLVDQGITAAEVQLAVTDAFIQAAVTRARMKNGRVNQSGVAIMTGLSRGEVRKLLTSDRADDRKQATHGAQKVLEGWSRDAEFCTKDGQPKRLLIRAGYGSFASLARRYSGDIPPRATLEELIRLRSIEISGKFVKRRLEKGVDLKSRQYMLTKAAEQLSHLFQLMGYPQALAPVVKLFDGVTVDVSDDAALRIAEQRVGQTARAFLNGIENSAGALLLRKPSRLRAAKRRLVINVSVASFVPRA
jgi:hypothetical protein